MRCGDCDFVTYGIIFICVEVAVVSCMFFFFSSRRRHTRSKRDWSSDVCSSDLLTTFAGDETMWAALPRDVASWWRRRVASSIERDDAGGWRVTGPAAGEARVELFARSEERRVGKEGRELGVGVAGQ